MSVILWGGSWRATAIAADYSTPLMTSAVRVGTATLALVAMTLALRAGFPARALWPWTAATGALMVVLGNHGQTEAVIRAGASTAAILGATTPFWAVIFGWLIIGSRASPLGLAGMVAGFGGVAIVVTAQLGGGEATDPAVGTIFGLLSPAAFALGLIVIKLLVERDPDLDLVGFTTGQYIVGSAILLALAFAIDGGSQTIWRSGEFWGAIAWLGPGASALAFLAFYAAIKRMDPARASTWMFLVPVIAVLVEAARGVVPEPITILGMAIAVAGVVVTSMAPERPATREVPLLLGRAGLGRARS